MSISHRARGRYSTLVAFASKNDGFRLRAVNIGHCLAKNYYASKFKAVEGRITGNVSIFPFISGAYCKPRNYRWSYALSCQRVLLWALRKSRDRGATRSVLPLIQRRRPSRATCYRPPQNNLRLTKPSPSAANDKSKATKDGLSATEISENSAKRSTQKAGQPRDSTISAATLQPPILRRQRTPFDGGTTTTSNPASDRGSHQTGAVQEARTSSTKRQPRLSSDKNLNSLFPTKLLAARESSSGGGSSSSAVSQREKRQHRGVFITSGRARPLSGVSGVASVVVPSRVSRASRAGRSSTENVSSSTESFEEQDIPSDTMGALGMKQTPQLPEVCVAKHARVRRVNCAIIYLRCFMWVHGYGADGV